MSQGNMGQVRIWRSSNQGKGHISKSDPKSLFSQCTLCPEKKRSCCSLYFLDTQYNVDRI